jgi:hypothetical protein
MKLRNGLIGVPGVASVGADPKVPAPDPVTSGLAPRSGALGHLDHLRLPRHAVRLYSFDQAQTAIDRLARLPSVREQTIGKSSEGRPMRALSVGSGPVHLVAIAGAHADEPMGTATCLALVEALATDERFAGMRDKIRLSVVPLANPDSTVRNEPWFSAWQKRPDLETYLRHVRRDLPGKAVEFGFRVDEPEKMQPESRAIAAWFDGLGKIDHYVSLHSMFLGGGALFLAMADDPKASPVLSLLTGEAGRLGLPLHDKDRRGQKGFDYLGPGLHAAPTAQAMASFFDAGAASRDAAGFTMSSMEYVRRKNDCSLCLVTEIPMVYDPAFASQEIVGPSRADEERRYADALREVAREVRSFVAEVPDAGDVLDGVEKSAAATERLASALLEDLERYDGHPSTRGVVLENDLNLARRRASLFGAAAEALRGAGRDGPHRDRAEALADEAIRGIRDGFALRYPSLETHMRLQMAAVLAGYASMPSSASE